MNYKDDIDVQIKDLKTTASEKLDARIYSAINKLLPRAEEPDIWRIIMKSNIAKLSTCITVLIIAALTVIHFSSGKIDIAAPVFANVMETIYKAKNVTYTQKMITSKSDFSSKNIATDDGLLRTEMPFGAIMLFDDTNGIQMALSPKQKKCIKTQKIGRKKSPVPFNRLNWIQKMHHNTAVYSHSEDLDGKNTDVFLIEVPYEKTTIWVDSQADLPVKIVMENYPNTDVEVVAPKYELTKSDFGGSSYETAVIGISSGRGSGLGISDRMTVIMTDFVWDSELDPSIFSFELSDDWEVVEKKQPQSKIDKDVLIKALSFWAKMNEGKFPDKVNDMMDHNLLNPLLVNKFNIGGDPDEQFDQACKQAQIVLSGLAFAQEKIVKSNWHYAGDGVTFGDQDTPIAWWQNEEDYTWTIIYADLSFDETAEEPSL
ncbi:MAG: hypothetical protein JXK07_16320 [Spirochaetes bacterium]|nr:hypothetical protein [Spirochaetota bacterium]